MPERIQRKRTKGWRMPPGAVYVGRPTKWGNPFPASPVTGITKEQSVEMYRRHMLRQISSYNPNCDPQYRGLYIEELRGKDLICWCKVGEPCHADVLLELANREEP